MPVSRRLRFEILAQDITRFVRVSMESKVSARDAWRYFCGCCWNEVSDRQEIARRLIEDGDI